MNNSSKPIGMTLVEFLGLILFFVVIGVILFPVFATGRDGRRVTCIPNLNQLSKALIMYQSDYDDNLPLELYGTNGDYKIDPQGHATATEGISLYDALYAYTKSGSVFQCPDYQPGKPLSHLGYLKAASGGKFRSAVTKIDSIGYLYNRRLFGNQAFVSQTPHKSLRSDQIPYLEGTIGFYDGKPQPKGSVNDLAPLSDTKNHFVKTDFDEPNLSGDPRHSDGLIMGFLDGHSKYFKKNAPSFEHEKDPNKHVYHFPYDLHGIPK